MRFARLLSGELRYAALFLFLELVPARTLTWPRAWILVVAAFVTRVVGGFRVMQVNPDLLAEREKVIHKKQPMADKCLLPLFMATFAAVIVISSLDHFRLRLFAAPTLVVSSAGLLALVVGWSIVYAALRANAFATTVVRHQPDREHQLVDRGPYSRVRHPMYAGLIPVMVGCSLWLESYAGALFSLVPIGVLVIRIMVEERVLRTSLPGYDEYCKRVSKRLIPFVW